MSCLLLFKVRFLDGAFHGRSDAGGNEWPPSPLRLFQALIAAFASNYAERMKLVDIEHPLRWLEGLCNVEIVAPSATPAVKSHRLYVPNNAGDLVAAALQRGNLSSSIAEHRTDKDVRPTYIGNEAVCYLYPLPKAGCPYLPKLQAAARSITHLGWGIDMVAADADVISAEDAEKLPGHRWRVVPSGGVPLRVPREGTLQNLMEKHAAFLGRLSAEGFRPVPPLRCFDVVRYHSPTADSRPVTRPLLAFEIHRTIEDQEKDENAGKSKFRPYHHVRRVATVAGMVRCATAITARQIGWTEEEINARIQGHGEGAGGQSTSDDRFLFLPLPSITPNGVSGIRRVVVVGPLGCDLAPLRRRLNGQELIDCDSKQPVAILAGIATTDRNIARYIGPAQEWTTVTPLILPGYDDPRGLRRRLRQGVNAEEQRTLLERLDRRALELIWSAFHQAGWTQDALEGAEVEYRKVGWIRGVDLAGNYELPPIKFPRFHVRIRFARPIRGPLAIGAGRYRGMGLFTPSEGES